MRFIIILISIFWGYMALSLWLYETQMRLFEKIMFTLGCISAAVLLWL